MNYKSQPLLHPQHQHLINPENVQLQYQQLKEDQIISQKHLELLDKAQLKLHPTLKNDDQKIREKLFEAGLNFCPILQLKIQTILHSYRLFDLFASVQQNLYNNPHRIHLYYLTCMFISSKYVEIYPPSLKDFMFLGSQNFKTIDYRKAEIEILTKTRCNLNLPLLCQWYSTLYKDSLPSWGVNCYVKLGLMYRGRDLAQSIRQTQEIKRKDKSNQTLIVEVQKRLRKRKNITKKNHHQKIDDK